MIAVSSVYDEVVAELEAAGGLLLNPDEVKRLEEVHWHDGRMTTMLLAKDIDVIIDALDLKSRAGANTRFLIAPAEKAGPDAIISGEKMSRFLALYRAEDFDAAVDLARTIQDYQGAGHSLSLHSSLDERARHLAMAARTCRVIVNQAHCFANGGFLIMVFRSPCPWVAAVGAEIRSTTT